MFTSRGKRYHRGVAMRTPILVTACLALAACGSSHATKGDADPADASDGVAPLTMRRSFEVTATQRPGSAGGAQTLGMPNTFTLVLDPSTERAVAGGGGEAASLAAANNDGQILRNTPPLAVGLSQESRPAGNLAYASLEVADVRPPL